MNIPKKIIWLAVLLLACANLLTAQEPTTGSMNKSSTGKTSKTSTTTPPLGSTSGKAADASLPSKAEIESFMRHMFGYNPAATWKIIDIQPSEAPHVAHVIAVLGNNQTATHLYVMPGGKYAVVGDMIPFGADPYAQIRAILVNGKGEKKGNGAAPVTIVEFSDLQCPYCKSAQPIIDRLLQEMPNTKLVFQPFPLAMHKWAMKAAWYGQCVGEQSSGAFWKFVQGVYDAQESITEANADEKLTSIAKSAGVDGAKVAACSTTPDTFIKVQQSIELGKAVGVGGTPTVFINGRKISAIKEVPFDLLKAMVDYEAAESKQGK